MIQTTSICLLRTLSMLVIACLAMCVGCASSPARSYQNQSVFKTPEAAVEHLAAAVNAGDSAEIEAIFGSDARATLSGGDPVADRRSREVVAVAMRDRWTLESKDAMTRELVIGNESWPFPIPLVKDERGWWFDTAAGKKEILLRRIGRNELDAIEVCHGYVEAQEEYASEPRGHATVVQYAQRIVGSADKQDGLAWRDADGTWRGPVGEKIARAIAEGYASKGEPYHGYYFKILKGQGPSAPLGALDFVVDGMMIGGFALVASPAEYEVSGIKSFIVSHDGVVYEKDLGKETLKAFQAMSVFDPDPSWTPVKDSD